MQGQSMPGRDPLMQRNQRKMKTVLNELTTREGLHPTVIDGVNLARSDSDAPRRPVLYQPSICVLVSGHTKGYIGSHCITYDENNYLVLPIPLPIECENWLSKWTSEESTRRQIWVSASAPLLSTRGCAMGWCAFWYACALRSTQPYLVQGLCVKLRTTRCADRRAARS